MFAALVAAFTPLVSSTALAQDEAPAKVAKAHVLAGDKAFREGDFVTALSEYRAATAAEESALSLEGIASSAYTLGRSVEAFDAYTRLLDRFGKLVSAKARDVARARLTELAAKTGKLTLTVEPPGAEVRVDDAIVGKGPLAAPVRVDAGLRRVRATLAGFAPVEREVSVPGGGDAAVTLTLEPSVATGHVVVREAGGLAARVRVDGKEVGAAPWQGELPLGPHTIELVGEAGSATAKLDVAKGANPEIALSAAAPSARLEVKISDGRGAITLDGKPMGDGSFAGDVPPGKHVLRVTRDGFVPYERTLDLVAKATLAETVTLQHADVAAPAAKAPEADAPAPNASYQGIYGGATFVGAFVPFGSGSDPELRCGDIGASDCTSPSSVGGGLLAVFGYFGDPIGVELAAGAIFDQTTSTATYTGQGTGNPLSVGVPREAEFNIYRVGPVAAVRLRASAHGDKWLVTAAGGAGLAQKSVFLSRNSVSTDGRALENDFVPDAVSYLSPALSFELGAGYRLTPGFSVLLGATLWLETAHEDLRTAPDGQAYLSNGQDAVPLATPSYRLASGTQTFVGPYLSVMFGP